MSIALTPVALQRVQRFVAETGALGLRFGVTRTGCSGWGHVADLARDQRADDTVFEHQGVKIYVDADSLSLAGIEKGIGALGKKARDGGLAMDDLQGGTFTISNGGVYGSLMSTPILNAPQSGILGMHKIQERPMAVGGQVVIRPMMYLALSYDHRVVDGQGAVTFLVRVKEAIEDPQRLLLDV